MKIWDRDSLEKHPELERLSRDLDLVGSPQREALYWILEYILKRLEHISPVRR